MSNEFYNQTNRPRRREPSRRQQMAKIRFLRLAAAMSVALVCVLVLVVALLPRQSQQEQSQPSQTTDSSTSPSTAPQPTEPETVIRLTFGGDLNVTDKVVAAGDRDGRYDYTELIMDVAPLLAEADATFLNLEGALCGAPYGSETASAPDALADALAAAGVDLIQLANSRTLTNGLTGLSASIQALRNAGIEPLGVFASNAEREESQGFTLLNIGGIRVAIVAFTKGMDGIRLPEGSEGCVNLLYTDYATTYQTVDEAGITALLQAAAAQQPDLTIAMVHWGSEYNDTISPTQEAIIELMQAQGVDAIVGTHSHFVQKIDYDEAAGTVVAYSLGDFLGDAEKAGTNYSVLLHLEVTRDNTTGQTRITGCDYTGLYTLTPEKDGEAMRILRILPAMEMYENNHVSKISRLTYENMQYAWKRIQARVSGT